MLFVDGVEADIAVASSVGRSSMSCNLSAFRDSISVSLRRSRIGFKEDLL